MIAIIEGTALAGVITNHHKNPTAALI